MLVLLFEVGTLLFYFLSAPQAGIPTLQTTAGAAVATWVSAVDMMNLMSVILTLGGEIFALIFGLLLLFRTIQVPAEPAKGSHCSAGRRPFAQSLLPSLLQREGSSLFNKEGRGEIL